MTGKPLAEAFRVGFDFAMTEAGAHEPSAECLELASAACARVLTEEELLAALRAEQRDTVGLACILVVAIHSHEETGHGLAAFRDLVHDDPLRMALLGVVDCIVLMNAFVVLDLGLAAPAVLRDELRRLLDDPRASARQRASLALGVAGLNDAATIAALERLIDQDAIGDAVVGAVLGRAWLDGAEPLMLRVQRTDPDWRVRAAATWLLGFRGIHDPIAYRDVRDEVKAIALAMTGEVSSSATVAEVLRIVRDPTASVTLRSAAAFNLCQHPSNELAESGREWLRRFRDDPAFEGQHPRIGLLLDLTRRNGEELP